jgi:hypothetical protein
MSAARIVKGDFVAPHRQSPPKIEQGGLLAIRDALTGPGGKPDAELLPRATLEDHRETLLQVALFRISA